MHYFWSLLVLLQKKKKQCNNSIKKEKIIDVVLRADIITRLLSKANFNFCVLFV